MSKRKDGAMDDTKRGLYHKFNVTRTDGSSEPGGKHENCLYYVLDLDHDPFAIPALSAYAEACRERYPALADDLMGIARRALNQNAGPPVKVESSGAESATSPAPDVPLPLEFFLGADGDFWDKNGPLDEKDRTLSKRRELERRANAYPKLVERLKELYQIEEGPGETDRPQWIAVRGLLRDLGEL